MDVRILGPGQDGKLASVLPGVFDHPVVPARLAEFLEDPRHHLAVAIDEDTVVGFASAVHYVHPDKEPEMWINEVGVAEEYRRRGVARALLRCLMDRAVELDCKEAWVLTERDNTAAVRLYRSLGGSEAEAETVMFSFRLGEEPPAPIGS